MSTFGIMCFKYHFSGVSVMEAGQVGVCAVLQPVMAALCPMVSSCRLLGLEFARCCCSVTQAYQMSKHTNSCNRIIKQQNHRIARVGRDLKRPLGPTFCGKRRTRWDYLARCPKASWKPPVMGIQPFSSLSRSLCKLTLSSDVSISLSDDPA